MTSTAGTLILLTVGNLILRMCSSIILARLLTPSDFGLLNIIMSIFFTIAMLTDLGFQSHIVRHPYGDDPFFGDVMWSIHAARGVLTSLLCMAISPLAAMILNKPELTWPLAIASLTLLINGFASMALFTILRSGGARRLSFFDFGLVCLQSSTAVLLALWLRDVWALILSMLLQSLIRTILSYVIFSGPGWRLARDSGISSEFLAFSRLVLISSTMTLLISQTDRFVLARIFTLAEFGLYGIAANLASAPLSFVASFVTRVNFPIYTQTWNVDRKHMPQVYREAGRSAALVYGFSCGGIVGIAPLLIHILYPPVYSGAALFLSILMIGTALKLQTFCISEVMTAVGKVGSTIPMNIARLIWLVAVGTLAFLKFGAIGLICVVGLIEVPALFFGWYLLHREGLFHIWRESEYLAIVILGAVLGGTICAIFTPKLITHI